MLACVIIFHFFFKNTYAWLHILAACYQASKKSRGTPNHMSLISTVAFKANSFQPRKKIVKTRPQRQYLCLHAERKLANFVLPMSMDQIPGQQKEMHMPGKKRLPHDQRQLGLMP